MAGRSHRIDERPRRDTPARPLLQVPRVLRGRFALLFAFLLSTIAVYPYAEVSGLGFYAFRVLAALVTVLTLYAVTFNRKVFALMMVLAVPAMLQHVILRQHATGWLPLLSRVLALLFDVLVISIIFRHVIRTERPNSETIFGALCVYLLLGFMFANFHAVVGQYAPTAFYMNPTVNRHTTPDRFDYIYFSFGTLTELGAAGMTAVAPAVRSLALLESISGVLYLAVLISRLLSAYRAVEEAV